MADPGWLRTESPFHAGELAIQAKMGVKERADRLGRRMIREYLTEQHQEFFSQLAYIIVGTVDELGSPWASILTGKPGFIAIASDRLLKMTAQPLLGDPFGNNLAQGVDIGLLGIELQTRRRNRLNGKVSAISLNGLEVTVGQAFGNCPKYIQARMFEYVDAADDINRQTAEINSFGESERRIITEADTLFIASAYQDESAKASKGVDVSHRGGKPGFVRLDSDRTLTIPDFSGNCMFNTIGNIEVNPRIGLLFIDFAQRDLLYLTGTSEIIWSETEINAFQGAERLIRFHLDRGHLVRASLPLRWTAPKFSPVLEHTGSW